MEDVVVVGGNPLSLRISLQGFLKPVLYSQHLSYFIKHFPSIIRSEVGMFADHCTVFSSIHNFSDNEAVHKTWTMFRLRLISSNGSSVYHVQNALQQGQGIFSSTFQTCNLYHLEEQGQQTHRARFYSGDMGSLQQAGRFLRTMFTVKATHVWCCVFLCSSVRACDISNDFVGAKSPGDIIIGGIFPIHQQLENSAIRSQPDSRTCKGFDAQRFIWLQAMIYTIEMINNSTLLPDIKLGYEIYDTCTDASRAVATAMKLLSKSNTSENCLEVRCNYTDYQPIVKAVVGEIYSELSIPIARIFNVMLMPQISSASSAPILSDKVRFSSFLRTVPSDIHQTKALARFTSISHWNWIGIIAIDDDYGRSAMTEFISNAQDLNICIGFQELIPTFVAAEQSDKSIQALVSKIEASPNASVIVLFAKPSIVIKLFNEIIQRNVTRTWIASDAWSVSRAVATMPNIKKVGNIFGFSFKNGNIPGFLTHLKNLRPGPGAFNKFIEEYKQLRFTCSDEYLNYTKTCNSSSEHCSIPDSLKLVSPLACIKPNESIADFDDNYLVQNVELAGTYATYLAIKSIAHALRNLLKCQEGACQKTFTFAPWRLLEVLKTVNFIEAGRQFYFDKFGDSINGYDLTKWVMDNGTTHFKTVGEYKLLDKKIYIYDDTFRNITKAVFSNCSQSCKPGQRKDSHSSHSCCYGCVPCTEGYYSVDWDMNNCLKCSDDQWSDAGSSKCNNRTIEFFRWNDGFAIVLEVFACFGVILIIVITIIFTLNLKTPAVKAAGGQLCYVILFSLFLSFVSTAFFIGKPTSYGCNIRQPLFGISFTICVSWILIKSFRIILVFKFDPVVRKQMKKLYKPIVILLVCTVIQVIVCALWLTLKRPRPLISYDAPKMILLKCEEGSNVAFGVMLGYIAILAIFCFLLAFMGRKLPDRYNEARFITFSMLIYIIVWISFVPVYVNTDDQYLPAVEVVAILASNYGILCCHFLPKCYIICFKKDENTTDGYMKRLREHYSQQDRVNCLKASAINVSIWSIPVPLSPLQGPSFSLFAANTPKHEHNPTFT
ncbi:G-protein coupled receptor family C group 6 member A-like [Heterodontus francisci]|uniref:G-protein coupled receptor family C group 6 member A-like n=1 Tax=Heterodontus francisci TaxID=7792 RepID=UPI00355AD744